MHCAQQLAQRPNCRLWWGQRVGLDQLLYLRLILYLCIRPSKEKGELEVNCRCAQLQVNFTASRTLCDVKIAAVESTQTGQPVKYGSKTVLVTEGYTVE